MMLKQSTAYTFRLGPFVDSTDGNTEENALTIAYTDVLLSKAGGALTAKADTTALTGTGANAHYTCVLNATDTGTLGTLRVWCHVSGALAVYKDFLVVPANVYDSLVAGSDLLDANASQVGGTTQTANDMSGDVDTILSRVVGTLATGTHQPQSGDAFARLGAPAGASISADVAAVKSDSAAILVDTGTDGVVIPQAQADKVWSTATRVLTANTNLNDPTADTIANAVKAIVVESQGSITLQQAVSIILSVLAGVTADAGATLKTPNGVATRVAATINASNERTSMTLTPSS